MQYKVKTSGPAAVTTADMKEYLRVTHSNEDTLIASQVAAVTGKLEFWTDRSFTTQTWELLMDDFPSSDTIVLRKPPLQSITSIKYIDTAGAEQTFAAANYEVDIKSKQGRIRLASGASWPSTKDVLNAVTIEFIAGYGQESKVPAQIKAAIKLKVGDFYENRQEQVIGARTSISLDEKSYDLLYDYRIRLK